jgi:hypothetical protein
MFSARHSATKPPSPSCVTSKTISSMQFRLQLWGCGDKSVEIARWSRENRVVCRCREHRRGIRPVFSVHLIFLECTAADGGRSAVHLLGEIILQAQLFDQVELGFEEVDMFFLVFQENLEEIG